MSRNKNKVLPIHPFYACIAMFPEVSTQESIDYLHKEFSSEKKRKKKNEPKAGNQHQV